MRFSERFYPIYLLVQYLNLLRPPKTKKVLSKDLLNWLNDGPFTVSLKTLLGSGLADEQKLLKAVEGLVNQKLLIVSQGGYVSLTSEGISVSEAFRPVEPRPLSASGRPFPKDTYKPAPPSPSLRPNSRDFLSIRSLLTSNQLFHST